MKKVLGIALIIFLVASIATAIMAIQILNDGSITITDLFDGNIQWHWDNDDNTLRWDWDDESIEYVVIEEQHETFPLADGDTLEVNMDFGRVQVLQSADLTDQVEFALSGRMPKSRDWSIRSDKEGSTVYYSFDIQEIRISKDWDHPVDLKLTVTVPENKEIDLDLKSDLGEIDVDGNYGDVEIETNLGKVVIIGSYGNVDLSTDLGEIVAEGSYGDVDIVNNLGALRFKGIADNLNFQLDLGDAEIELYEFDTVTGFVNLGSIEFVVDDDVDGKDYFAETGLGSVQYHGEFYDTINGERVELRADLGDIELWRKDIHE